MFFFLFNDTATTEIYTYLTHSFPSRRSSDLAALSSLLKGRGDLSALVGAAQRRERGVVGQVELQRRHRDIAVVDRLEVAVVGERLLDAVEAEPVIGVAARVDALRSEEHTSELQSLMRISYAVFCLKKK